MSRATFRPLAGLVLTLVAAGLLSSCQKTPREKILAKDRVVFMCQHPQGKAIIPEELKTHSGEVDVIAPMWYDIRSDGQIALIFPDIDLRDYLAFCRENGIAVLPVFRNFKPKDFLLNPAALDRAVREIAETLKAEGFDGLTIDIEEDCSDSRTKQPMLDFLSRLYREVRAQERVVCVTFNPVYWGRGWQNEDLLPFCDWAFSMFYDYAGPWNKKALNATAPYEWPEQNRDLKRDVARIMNPANSPKVIFGIPAYGNRITLDEAGHCVDFKVAYVNEFLAEQREVKAPRQWDPNARTPKFEYQAQGKRYIVWYEDEESYRWRMTLACELKAAGVGIWSIGAKGGLDHDIWKVLREYRGGYLCKP